MINVEIRDMPAGQILDLIFATKKVRVRVRVGLGLGLGDNY